MRRGLAFTGLDTGARPALICARGSIRGPERYQRRPQKRHAAAPHLMPGKGAAASRRTMVHDAQRRASAGALGLP